MSTSSRRLGKAVGATSVLMGVLFSLAGPASATPVDLNGINNARMVRTVQGATPKVKVDKDVYIARATKAGATVTPAQERAIRAASVSCWSWDAWQAGLNIWGATVWKSHHRVNWCGDGSWIRSHAYTDRWGDSTALGWTDEGLTQKGNRYGVNWNQYNSWTQRKFCLVKYFSCIQEANPYTNTTVLPNGAGWFN